MTDRTWRIPWNHLDLGRLLLAAKEVAGGYEGVTVEVEAEADDCHTCFFAVPGETGGTVEISVYDMEGDGIVLSLELDASDNVEVGEDAHTLAEDLAELLEARPLDL
jgi:hypothetical protein